LGYYSLLPWPRARLAASSTETRTVPDSTSDRACHGSRPRASADLQPRDRGLGAKRNAMTRINKQEQDTRINAAIKDWQVKKPLPGLPSLKRPVRIKLGSYVCNTEGELLNPNVNVLMTMHECMITTHTALVRVLQPTDERGYISGYYHEIVEVSFQSAEMSDGNVFTGWAPIATLSNSVTPQ
jgi:hypothetical protein